MRAAALCGGRLLDYAIERPGAPELVGAVLRGRVTARLPALAGAFVALGEAGDGFLPDSQGAKALGVGALVAVRVTRAAQASKGPRVALAYDPVPAGPLGLVAPGPGALTRLAALHPAARITVDDPALAATHAAALGKRLTVARDAWDESVAGQTEALAEPVCALPGGGRMSIQPTAALVAIDLDLAAGSLASGRKTASHLAANAAFLPELALQIRLRNLGGAIVVDLAGLSPRRRVALGPGLEAALADDPLCPRFLGFSALGLAEILRPRVHRPLHELLGTAHAEALAALRSLGRACAAEPSHAPALRAAADVSDALIADAAARAAFAARCGRTLILRTDRALPRLAWALD